MLTAECCLLIFKGFSAERLMHFLNALGHDVEIRIWLIANCQACPGEPWVLIA